MNTTKSRSGPWRNHRNPGWPSAAARTPAPGRPRRAQRAAMGAALFRHEHDRHHQHEGHQDDRQIDLPQFARPARRPWPAAPARPRTAPPAPDAARTRRSSAATGRDAAAPARPGRLHGAGLRGTTGTTQRATARQTTPRQAMVQNRPDSPTSPPARATAPANGEGQADRATDHGHGAGAHLVAGGVGQPGGDGGEMAPAPRMARPMVIQNTSDAWAQTTLPATNNRRPAITTGRRPQRSDASPKGICMKAWVRPYMPSARPTRAGSSPPAGARRHREDRQQQEQPQHAPRTSRQRHAGAALGRGQFQFGFCRHADYWTVMASKRPLGKPGGPT